MPTSDLPRCPQCNARMTIHPDGDALWCQFCGVVRRDAAAITLLNEYLSAQDEHPPYLPPANLVGMDSGQRFILNHAWDCIQHGDMKTADYILHAGLTQYANFADAWYLLSLTTEDRGDKLIYLDKALEAQPYHEYAWRDKGILEGVIPNGEGQTPAEPAPGQPVEARSTTEECPTCGGALAFDPARGVLVCGHCGYSPDMPRIPAARTGYDRLDNALLQRRFGFSREWHIGQRVLVCQNCHAQLTLGATTLSTLCPFCASAHILVQDAVGSFEEPDALLPFRLDRRAAGQAVHDALEPDLRAQVERGQLTGVYLPFWCFEGLVTIIVPLTGSSVEPFRPGTYPVSDVLVSGVSQPQQAVLHELMPYDLNGLIAYDPRYLAQWPAQIYRVDVVEASITARAYVKYAARQQASGANLPAVELARTDSRDYRAPSDPRWRAAQLEIEGLNYRLLLLPVWMVTLVLGSGVQRPAVVNGQTGEAVISASFSQPERIVRRPDRPARPRSTVIRPLPPRR